MGVDLLDQALTFLGAAGLGTALGLVYDLFRILRRRVRLPLLGSALDLLFWALVTAGLFLYAIAAGGGDIAIKSNRRAYTLIATIQEEVHRFAIGFHRQRSVKKGLSTALTEIPGIGPARAKLLFKHFKTLKAITDATEEELAGIDGMNRPSAAAVYGHFHKEDAAETPAAGSGEA